MSSFLLLVLKTVALLFPNKVFCVFFFFKWKLAEEVDVPGIHQELGVGLLQVPWFFFLESASLKRREQRRPCVGSFRTDVYFGHSVCCSGCVVPSPSTEDGDICGSALCSLPRGSNTSFTPFSVQLCVVTASWWEPEPLKSLRSDRLQC